ncbi:SCO1 family electron transport protein [Sporosarcina newyorkensis 2681]|uniref:SCO1 family electron transport protein n=1 Tax=Sporosarcina newyorkensis 2681 TaxID=1027292 RepID=F9DY59_9BACL|nr:SCO family protein [Sporosarcina newyorkensis]EGQ19272.1 SCO1 family electron transport protein [Sporosarcina newyorkensis 2681]
MRKSLCFILISLFSLLLVGCGQGQGIKNPLNLEVREFSFTNQEGEEFGLDDLKGKVWIADFVFTNCTTVCLPMMANMAELQGKLEEEDLSVELVSFSVDPVIDTPEVLKEYAGNFNADLSNWNLLTGYSQKTIKDFALKSFKTIAVKPDTGDQVVHGTSFYLINKEGTVMKDYSGLDIPTDEIINDIKLLNSEE